MAGKVLDMLGVRIKKGDDEEVLWSMKVFPFDHLTCEGEEKTVVTLSNRR